MPTEQDEEDALERVAAFLQGTAVGAGLTIVVAVGRYLGMSVERLQELFGQVIRTIERGIDISITADPDLNDSAELARKFREPLHVVKEKPETQSGPPQHPTNNRR